MKWEILLSKIIFKRNNSHAPLNTLSHFSSSLEMSFRKFLLRKKMCKMVHTFRKFEVEKKITDIITVRVCESFCNILISYFSLSFNINNKST